MDSIKEITALAALVDNGTTYMNVGHVTRSDFAGNQGRDVCMEMFGEEDDECRKHNADLEASTNKK